MSSADADVVDRLVDGQTLVAQATADRAVDPANGRLLAGRNPGARLLIFPDLGRLLFWPDPDVHAP